MFPENSAAKENKSLTNEIDPLVDASSTIKTEQVVDTDEVHRAVIGSAATNTTCVW